MKKRNKKDNHHRLSKALGGSDTFPKFNLVEVPKHKHEAWHTLFAGHRSLESIVQELNLVWIRPDKKLIIVDRETTDPNQLELF